MNGHVIFIIKKHVYSKTKYVNIPSFHSSHHFNSPLKLKFRQSNTVCISDYINKLCIVLYCIDICYLIKGCLKRSSYE